jgi:hypothetical protein
VNERAIWRAHAAGRLGGVATVRALASLPPWWERWRWGLVAWAVGPWVVWVALLLWRWRL